MSNTLEASAAIRRISSKAQLILLDTNLSNTQKLAQVNQLAVEMKKHQSIIAGSVSAGILRSAGDSLDSPYSPAAVASGRALKGLATPNLRLSTAQVKGFYTAATSGQNLTIGLKDVANSETTRGQLPPTFVGLVERQWEPTRLLDHLPTSATASPSVEYISHVSNAPSIAAPALSLGASTTTGGTFASGSYFWRVTALTPSGESVGSNEVTATVSSNGTQTLSWPAPTGASGYRVYRGTKAGTENALVFSGTALTFTDTGLSGSNASVPTVDRTGSAAPVHAGNLMPETSLVTVANILTMRKLAIFSTVTDELLSDFGAFSSYLEVELQRQIIDAENYQILNGDGTGDNLLGLVATPGTLTRAKGATDAALDIIEQGITDLRNGPSFVEPDALIVNPATFSSIRRTKNTLGNYVLGDPGQTSISDVWGVPVLQTSQCPPGAVVLANLETCGEVFVREGITLAMTNSADADFESGRVKIRATERLALGIARPSAINILTGF